MPAPIPSPVPGFFDYQVHQLAMYIPTRDGLFEAQSHWQGLGYTGWITDHAELKGILNGQETVTKATMLFNYDIMPMEYELLHYSGPSRWENIPQWRNPFVSHVSIYTDDVIFDTRKLCELLHTKPFHRFITQKHTNPGVAGKKRFIESIFNTHDLLGFDTKLIQKVPHDYNDSDWLGLEF